MIHKLYCLEMCMVVKQPLRAIQRSQCGRWLVSLIHPEDGHESERNMSV